MVQTWPLAVVVGAGGMAMAVARRLGARHRLLLADLDGPHLDRQVDAMRADGYDVSGLECDVTDASAVADLAAAAGRGGPWRSLAHVVGLSPSTGDAAAILRVDLLGPIQVADAFVDLAGPGAAAVFVASVAAHLNRLPDALVDAVEEPLAADFVERIERAAAGGLSPALAYQLSKLGLIRACRRRAPNWGARGARIMSISPGLIDTPMGARESQADTGKRRALLERTPLRREGTMREIAAVVDFLLSDRASFISGIDLLIDGGLAAAVAPRGAHA